MRFSVIIPLYNKAPYVAKAISSVLAQTFTDYELLVVDDGSQDDSAAIALKSVEGRGNCRLIHQKNAGVSVARNNGAATANGDYLCFLDADDWWEPLFLEEMDKLIAGFPDAGIYGTSYNIVDETNHKTRSAVLGTGADFEKGEVDYFRVYAKTFYMPLWTGAVCIPKVVFYEVGGFKPNLKMGEDFDLWVRIALCRKVVILNKPLSNYNQDVNIKLRAIGSQPDPQTQFAFCADYLDDAKRSNPDLKFAVEMVQIVCLRSYYLSKEYHELAKATLGKLDLDAHRDRPYANYLFHSVFLTRCMDGVFRFMRKIKIK